MDRQDTMKISTALAPVAAATAGHNSTGIDRANFGTLTFAVTFHQSSTSISATLALQEGSTSTPTQAVAAADVTGDTGGFAAGDVGTKKLGYIGKERYVRCVVVPSAATTAQISIVAIQDQARKTPQA